MSTNARFAGLATACVALLALTLLLSGDVAADGSGPRVFETPEAAAKALIEATKNNDDAALKAMAGPASADLIQSGSDPAVAKDRKDFAEAAEQRLQIQDNDDGTKTLVVGDQEWPLPIPLKAVAGGWVFDAEKGREEMLARRIGRNELRAIKICNEYARAQLEYASEDRDGDGVREYAQKILSDEGQKNGLYWPDEEGQPQSPFGPFITTIEEILEGREMGDAVGGYVWRVLTGQGSSAPGGRHSYVINGNMIAGFALVGTPAEYGKTGIMTFMVSHHGKVVEKDLGQNGRLFVRRCMKGFNPDSTWSEVAE